MSTGLYVTLFTRASLLNNIIEVPCQQYQATNQNATSTKVERAIVAFIQVGQLTWNTVTNNNYLGAMVAQNNST